MKIRAISIIDTLGNVHVPVKLRHELGWSRFDVVEFYSEGDAIIMRASKKNHNLKEGVCYRREFNISAHHTECGFCPRCKYALGETGDGLGDRPDEGLILP